MIIAVAAVALGIVVVSHRAAVEAVYPLERAALFVRRSVWPRMKGVFDGPGNAAEVVRLRREVDALVMLQDEVARLERENASLRRSLDYAAREPQRWIAAPILASHRGSLVRDRVVRVGRGAADGVTVDSVVASPDGLVGLVTGVTEHTSEVTLVTDRTLKVACKVMLENGRSASGIIAGGDGDGLVIDHISGLAVDAPKALVLTSGRGGVFPEGFVVGRLIRSAATEGGDRVGLVGPAVDFDNLEDVFIRRER